MRVLIMPAALLVAVSAHAVTLVNDAFTDTDRNSGLSSNPVVITATNTQWVTNTTLTPSASGMLWDTATGSGSRYATGYFPLVTVGSATTTFTLTFTTGNSGATTNNLRIAFLDSRPSDIVKADGGLNNAAYVNDTGYGFFSSASTVGGGNTTNLTLRTYQRNTLASTDPLSAAADWGNNSGTTQLAASSGSTGYFQPNTTYSLVVAMTLTGGSLDISTSLTGGNLTGLSYSATDAVSPTTSFDALIFRLGGNGQFSSINFNSLTITGTAAIPEPSTCAAIAGALGLGLAAWRRQRRVRA